MSFYDEYFEPECDYDPRTDWIHIDDIPDLNHARYHMEELLSILYGEKELSDIENHILQVCNILEMKIPITALRIAKEK